MSRPGAASAIACPRTPRELPGLSPRPLLCHDHSGWYGNLWPQGSISPWDRSRAALRTVRWNGAEWLPPSEHRQTPHATVVWGRSKEQRSTDIELTERLDEAGRRLLSGKCLLELRRALGRAAPACSPEGWAARSVRSSQGSGRKIEESGSKTEHLLLFGL